DRLARPGGDLLLKVIFIMNPASFRNTLMALTLASTLLFAACGKKAVESAEAQSNRNRPSERIDVAVAPVVERTAARGIEVVGSLMAEDEVTISSQAAGNLDDITVDVGSAVQRGQAIGRLDARESSLRVAQAEAALRQAEARLGLAPDSRLDPDRTPDVRQAKAALERARYDLNAARNLVDNGDISKQQLDVYQKTFEQAEARHQAALENVRNLAAQIEEKRAALALAKKQLGDTAIVSPLGGVVKEKLASRGEYMQPGKPIITVVQINPLRLKLEVPEAFAASIKAGQEVTLRVDTFGDRQFKGTIRRINPSVDEKNRSLIAEAEVRNDGALLRPGMFARAEIVSNRQGTALMVPEKAVVSLAGVNKVFVLEGDHAAERQVKLGVRDGSLVEIIEGVKVGDRVITTNADRLHDGATVSST
ncbi:MAG TPA: efflux RND transporter periplasmic adaptor subunit, partial [Blastocatellia bacterium]